MIIYSNNSLKKKDYYDVESIYYDSFIYSNNGIYKKYKNHFYELDICDNIECININKIKYYVQENENVINKSKIITYIPFNHYYVSRKTIKHKIDDDIYYVKEIDNDVYINEYYILSHLDDIKKLCLHLDNKI